jgi:hypothetical protein
MYSIARRPQHGRRSHPGINCMSHEGLGLPGLAEWSFTRPYKTSYRGLKLPRVSAAFGRSYLRLQADLPQVARASRGLLLVIKPIRISRAGTDEPLAPVRHREVDPCRAAISAGSGST